LFTFEPTATGLAVKFKGGDGKSSDVFDAPIDVLVEVISGGGVKSDVVVAFRSTFDLGRVPLVGRNKPGEPSSARSLAAQIVDLDCCDSWRVV